MASNILIKSTMFLFLISCALMSTAIAALVKDTDSEPVINGAYSRQYYIVPQNIGIGGGLSLKPKSKDSPCPLYITRDKDETFPGIPVRINSSPRVGIITTSLPNNIVFIKDTPNNVCMEPLGWKVTSDDSTGKSYVTTGGKGDEMYTRSETFTIQEVEGAENNVYKIQHAAGKSDVGIFNKDGLLGINSDNTLSVVFEKAYDDVLLMKV